MARASHPTPSTPATAPTSPAPLLQTVPLPWTAPAALPEALETDRLRLRYWQARDAAGMLAALDADRSSYLPWLPWVEADNLNHEQCVFNIERFRRRRADPGCDDFVVGIFDKSTDAPLGGTGLHRVQPAWHEAEIGYWIDPRARGRGFCTEAIAGLIGWALAPQDRGGWGLRRIHIRCAATNAASAAIPRKLGLTHEATLRKERFVPGIGWDDTLVFSVLVGEWSRPPAMRASRDA